MKTNCNYCNKEIDKKPSHIKKYKNLFCNRECRDNFKNTKVQVKCKNCEKDLLRRPSEINKSHSGDFFCNKSCFATYSNKGKRRNWKGGLYSYRPRALKTYGEKCNRCGYNEYSKVLEVHHVNHNRNNNEVENLEVLCPTCHSVEHQVFYKGNSDKPDILPVGQT